MRPWAAAVLLVVLPGVPCSGQERLVLTDQDTWRVVEQPDPLSPRGQLAVARAELAAGRPDRAEILASRWLKEHPDDPQLADAYLIRGDSLRALGREYESLFDYEHIARTFPGSEHFVTALEREYEIAMLYVRGTKRKIFGLRLADASDEAEELLLRIQERLPGSQLAEQAAMSLADFYFDRREMGLATEMYSIFLQNFPRSVQTGRARVRLIYAHLASFRGPDFDASGLREARVELEDLRAASPATAERAMADALLTRVDESEARKLLVTARWYLQTEDPIGAELLIRRLLAAFPRTVAAIEAADLAARILPRLPPAVRREAPDYEALRRALSGGTGDGAAAEPEEGVGP